jgi:integrase/recombinase XerD
MFDTLFKDPQVLSRHQTGPLSEERLEYLTSYYAARGTSRSTISETAYYLLIITQALRLSERPGEIISYDELHAAATRWGNKRPRKAAKTVSHFINQAIRWLTFLGRIEQRATPSHRHSDRVAAYVDHMRHEQGLSPVTVSKRSWRIQTFLDRLGTPTTAFEDISIEDIDALLTEMGNIDGYARTTLQTWATCMRSFFRYAATQGWCRKGLAEAIMGPRVYAQESLITGPSWDQVHRLLPMTTGDDPKQIRDHAILMLFTVYALRSQEVGQLQLAHIDWDKALLSIVNDKNGRTRVYPLTQPVGNAILRYLTHARPDSRHRRIFLGTRPPFQPLTGAGLYSLVAIRLRRMGLSLPHYGPHSLRHACATHLLNEGGLSLKEIGDHLGHSDPDSTQVYAKVDLAGLRRVGALDLGGLV